MKQIDRTKICEHSLLIIYIIYMYATISMLKIKTPQINKHSSVIECSIALLYIYSKSSNTQGFDSNNVEVQRKAMDPATYPFQTLSFLAKFMTVLQTVNTCTVCTYYCMTCVLY